MNTPNDNHAVSFFEFIEKRDIQVPVIQRDYVQGRALTDKEKEKRDDFAKKLMNALLPGGVPCHLDFVYGGRESFGGGEVASKNAPFLPLDGQQRLTTLFLLHWTLLQKNAPTAEGSEPEKETFRKRMEALAKFTYKTRISSGRFCRKLIELQAEPGRSLTGQIKEKYWYDPDMQADPTVKAMMQMLERMEEMLGSEPYQSQNAAMLANLYADSYKRITFDVLDMDQYNLTDGLYVKMNARGKELTAFENWKASFTGLIEQCYNAADGTDADASQSLLLVLDEKKRIEKERFSYSMEHEWNDVFWKIAYQDYLDRAKKANGGQVPLPNIDDAFMHFFNNLTRLFFFISPKGQSLNAEDYKAGLWSTVSDTYAEHEELREMLFDILDTLHEIDAANGSIRRFFDSIFAKEAKSGKVCLLDGSNTDLFESACSSDSFSSNHILLFAILLYCTRHKVYVSDEHLLNYVRFCRNYLYEHNYFDTSNVTVSPQIRVSEMAQYLRFFEALATEADPLVSFGKLELKDDYALREKAKLAYYQHQKVLELVWKLEDLPYTYGNLSAFASLLAMCCADEAYCTKVWDAVDAFMHAPALTKVQLFVALGYKGIEVRNCAYGKAVFLGGEYKGTPRWMVHFRKKYDAVSPFNAWMMRYVEAFSRENDLDAIVAQHMPDDPHSVAYYLLKYPDILAAQVPWRDNRNHAPFYFAMRRPWKDMDMIAIHSFTSRPLNAYQVCPMANAVAREISRFKKYNEAKRMWYSGQFADKHGITIDEYPNVWDKIIFTMCFGAWEWLLPQETRDLLSPSLQEELQCDGDHYVLKQAKGKGLVETAVDFLNKVLDDFEQRGLLQ